MKIGLTMMIALLSFYTCASNFNISSGQDTIPITTFTNEELEKGEPIGWKSHKGICRKISNRIMPRLIEIEGKRVLYVNANDNGTIIFKPVSIDPEEYQFLSWKWKVSNILPNSREKEVGKDDYPAIVCIVYGNTFPFLSIPYSYKILIYAYGNNIAVGERFENPCEARARIIIVQSGEKDTGKWLDYKVNHYQDYIKEFGQEPPKIIFVGLQTNADRTHGNVEAWYSDIFLSSK